MTTLQSIEADGATIELIEHRANPIGAYRAVVRPEVAKFAIEMETVLRENDHKSGWDKMELDVLLGRIRDGFFELNSAYYKGKSIGDIRSEAIDIANFCMFLCHNYPETEAEQ